MTSDSRIPDPSDSSASQSESELEQRLGAALHAKVDGLEPVEGSYVRLERRLATEQPSGRSRGSYLAVAAALVLLAVAAGYFVTATQRTTVDAANEGDGAVDQIETSLPSDDAVEDRPDTDSQIIDAVPTEPERDPSESVVSPADYEGAAFTGPRRETKTEAATAFLDLLGVDYGELEIDGLSVGVRNLSGDGDVLVELELQEAAVVKGRVGYQVVEVTTPWISIASPEAQASVTRSPMAVVGEATTSSGTLEIRLLSARDGSLLARSATEIDSESSASFTAELDIQGAEWAWLVVADPAVETNVFAAVPVSFVVGLDSVEYTVFNISADDPEQGLNVRDLPGTEGSEVVANLPAGTTGVTRLGRVPVFLGDDAWWQIEVLFDGARVEGWVNSAFLVDSSSLSKQDISETELVDLARRFATAGATGDIDTLVNLPWARKSEIPFGWWGGLVPLTLAELTDTAFWQASHQWGSPSSLGDPVVTLSALSFMELPNPDLADVQYQLDGSPSPYGADQLIVDEQFSDYRSVTIVTVDEATEWRTTTLFVVRADHGLEIVAVGVTIWTP